MVESFAALNVVTQALVATTVTYLLTAVGTLPVLFFRSAPRRLMDAMMGFAAGVMVAASCWSLLVPAIDRGGVMQASFLPYGMAAAAGAMLYVVVEELIPRPCAADRPMWQPSASSPVSLS
jgi:ZIP family zinc transporter